ncbi:hypothetical protein [Halarcobacter sp.]|uniref:hypothetical protein n=1 Tax=Halarcobacter sp. TaxID=2321133 RepID=UPI002AA63F54|nr:hypothetical protein [Halarcobacter sp.]
MEDIKKNELKGVMDKTFSQEEIENRLKEQIKAASNNRDKMSKRKTTQTKMPINKKNKFSFNNLNFNSLLLILVSVLAILIFVTIYLFNQDKKDLVKPNKTDEEKSYFNKLYNSKNYDTFKCYSFKNGKISLPIKECKENLDKFLDKNKTANRFEVVPLISENDSIIYNDIEKNLSDKTKEEKEKIKEYLNIGLSTERILESVWYIKKTLGESTIVTSSQYYVKSDNEKEKGVIIRAYH